MKVSVAGKGGVGKTALTAALARRLADRARRTLAVDCDPNPNLAESFGLDSGQLERFSFDDLRRAPGTLELAREPSLVGIAKPALWLLSGPPSSTPLNDAVARGIAGVLIAERFDWVLTDLGAGPEFTRIAVGGVLNPAELCLVVSDGLPAGELAADRIEQVCRARGVSTLRVCNRREGIDGMAASLAERLLAAGGDRSAGS